MSELGGHDVHDEAFIHAERLGHRYGGASSTQNLAGHAIRVVSVAWNGSGDTLASSADDGTVYIWSASQDFRRISSTGFSKHTNSVNQVQWSPNDNHILGSTSSDQGVLLWDLRDGGASAQSSFVKPKASPEGASWFDFGADHRVFVAHPVGRNVAQIATYDLRQNQEPIEQVFTVPHQVMQLRWLAASKLLAVGTPFGRLVIASAEADSQDPPTTTLNAHTAAVLTMQTRGQILVTGGADSMVHVWDSSSLSSLHSFSSADNSVRSVSISHDGNIIAAAYEKEITLFTKHAMKVGAVSAGIWATAFHPSRPLLAYGGESLSKIGGKYSGQVAIANFESDK